MWIGYDTKHELNHGLSSAEVWKNIIGEYADSIESDKTYPECDSVIEAPMCTYTGQIATGICGAGSTGYWKSTNAPYCTSHAGLAQDIQKKAKEQREGEEDEQSEDEKPQDENSENENSENENSDSENAQNEAQEEAPAAQEQQPAQEGE